ncbi:histone-like nucleoid-structuring protein Lsr2 [Kocuria sp. UCD-OTCP]|uniref:histone-like nucleoid-structuring protein Lsr2 n=1 Tax=Kocuria sp. UCD-OTCP TaxID=1292021 RepID=UPI0004CE4EB0|nr:Lsr2 family protein [Kocuria sp. UCD-OTCP]
MEGTPPVAQKVEVHFEDDLDSGPADDAVTLALAGKDYENDLSTTNAEKLREALHPFEEAGRKASRRSSTRSRASDSAPDTAKIRAWDKENGYKVFDRGRIH